MPVDIVGDDYCYTNLYTENICRYTQFHSLPVGSSDFRLLAVDVELLARPWVSLALALLLGRSFLEAADFSYGPKRDVKEILASTTVLGIALYFTYLILAARLVLLDKILAVEIVLRLPRVLSFGIALPFQIVLHLQVENGVLGPNIMGRLVRKTHLSLAHPPVDDLFHGVLLLLLFGIGNLCRALRVVDFLAHFVFIKILHTTKNKERISTTAHNRTHTQSTKGKYDF